MRRRTTKSTRTATLFPKTTLFRAWDGEGQVEARHRSLRPPGFFLVGDPGDHVRSCLRRQRKVELCDALVDAPLHRRVGRIAPSQLLAGDRVAAVDEEQFELRWRHLRTNCQLARSEEHTSELQSLMRNSYAVF